MMDRPITTLFMLESLDGKINSGFLDTLDVDRDWKNIDGVKEGLHQYYEIEQTTDLCSFNTGRVFEKIGINEKENVGDKIDVTFVVLDRKPHLSKKGLVYLSNYAKKVIIVTNNKNHPVYEIMDSYDNLEVLYYDDIDFKIMMNDLYNKYGIDRMTIQSGGTINSLLLRDNLIDYVHVVVAPLLVGGRDTNTLVDGESIKGVDELNKLRALELINLKKLDNSYIELEYKVINK